MDITDQDVVDHFNARVRGYDRSSSWCTDEALGRVVLDLAQPARNHAVLDVACGTGLVSRLFTGRVRRLTGLDVTSAMADQARPYLDELIISPAESMPFPDDTFDLTVCRQGIQFMELPTAVDEMLRRAGCDEVRSHRYVSVEDVDVWSDNGAIGDDAREAIRQAYRKASPAFRELHAVEEGNGRIVDHMLFIIATGRARPAVARRA